MTTTQPVETSRARPGSLPLYDVVVPTVGRPSVFAVVRALHHETGPEAGRIVVVDDGTRPRSDLGLLCGVDARVRVVATGGRGPASARNAGIQATNAPWVVFLDDDVEPTSGWGAAIRRDLASASAIVGGVQGRITVPLPRDRRPTDWERSTAALAASRWITADMAYRRAALVGVNGFDERFPRAYREDADLALRVRAAGWDLVEGKRRTVHPVRPAPWWVSIAKQRGNADDVRMRALHGRDWRPRAAAPRGRALRHGVTTVLLGAAVAALLAHRPRLAALAAAAWALLTAEFVTARVRPGPLTRDEVARITATSVVIPPYATAVRLAALARYPVYRARRSPVAPEAVVIDRDGTIVEDVPYNSDPDLVRPVAGARAALERLRTLGLPVVIASNQSGVARGILTDGDVARVNARVEDLLGPFDAMLVCPHGPAESCGCRKPAPGLVARAAALVGTTPDKCVVIGDCAADIGAARSAGARSILVPNAATRPEEVRDADLVADDLQSAVDYVTAMAGL
jgi:histidinol-phosphate phosphatase family protein